MPRAAEPSLHRCRARSLSHHTLSCLHIQISLTFFGLWPSHTANLTVGADWLLSRLTPAQPTTTTDAVDCCRAARTQEPRSQPLGGRQRRDPKRRPQRVSDHRTRAHSSHLTSRRRRRPFSPHACHTARERELRLTFTLPPPLMSRRLRDWHCPGRGESPSPPSPSHSFYQCRSFDSTAPPPSSPPPHTLARTW